MFFGEGVLKFYKEGVNIGEKCVLCIQSQKLTVDPFKHII